ncbi:hypothetical protein PD653_2979 [Nocardioides sp. PD653]|nr:hypothetical protein PD653B2_2991 [Nocardioides sp. PD653-B2]GAW55554.1 hypothetical protein PD653_2979 [Nocardioides sp. PD653]
MLWPILIALLTSLSACGASDDGPNLVAPTPGGTLRPPCDPSFGFPEPAPGCPDDSPETGWLTRRPSNGRLVLESFRSLSNDAEGEAYAERHGLDFPFPNDYYDAPQRSRHTLALGPDIVCTGIIRVDYREPLNDHPVDCTELVAAAGHRPLAVAVWRDGPSVVQVSELYRP